MKVNFNDVANLYIGATVRRTYYHPSGSNIEVFGTLSWDTENDTFITKFPDYTEDYDYDYARHLVLRSLSSITPEEENKASEIWHEAMDRLDNPMCAHAAITRYLLSKKFDLYGLIEMGEAIEQQ